jgi:hypothetical protein
MLGLQMFLIDLRKDLIQKQGEKFQTRGKDIQNVFGAFIDEMVASSHDADLYAKYLEAQPVPSNPQKHDMKEVSGKVSQLISILSSEYDVNPRLKAIIFVKDRSVATYLKKILDYELARAGGDLASKLRCNFAIGFQGKSLTNKAYRSTKTDDED